MNRAMDAEPSSALARDLAILLLAGVLSLGALWLAGGPRLAPPPELAGAVVTGPAHFYWLAAFSHPGWLLELMGLRVFWLLFYAYPPHHPLWYGVAAPGLALALYLLAAWGTWRGKGQRGEACLVWGFLAVAAVVAALTWVASDGRFLTRPLCCLVFLAGMGLERLLPGNLMVGSGKTLPKR